jgi:hypothetical protein
MEEILYLVVVTVAFIILLIMFIEFMKMMLLPVVYLCGYICDVLKISKLINWAYEGAKAKNGMNMVEVIEDKWSLIYETPLVAFVFYHYQSLFLGQFFA